MSFAVNSSLFWQELQIMYNRLLTHGLFNNVIIYTDSSQTMYNRLLTQGLFYDVIIYADSGQTKIKAHRLVLANKSEVFCAMFRYDMKESSTGKIIIEDFDGSIIKRMLEFMYKPIREKFKFNEVNEAKDLLRAADKYDLSDLGFYCVNYLTTALDETNAVSILLLADTIYESSLKQSALEYIIENVDFMEPHAFQSVRKKNAQLLEEIAFAFAERCMDCMDNSWDSNSEYYKKWMEYFHKLNFYLDGGINSGFTKIADKRIFADKDDITRAITTLQRKKIKHLLSQYIFSTLNSDTEEATAGKETLDDEIAKVQTTSQKKKFEHYLSSNSDSDSEDCKEYLNCVTKGTKGNTGKSTTSQRKNFKRYFPVRWIRKAIFFKKLKKQL